VAFSHELDDIVLQRQAIERDLRQALQTGDDIGLAYQPIFDANGTTILGAEALLRWQHPVHGSLPPGVVIAIAEERGLISSVAELVVRRACGYLRDDDRFPWIAVNVSGGQFRDASFADTFLEIVRTHGIEPRRLQIEITETSLIDNPSTAEAILSRLHEAGVIIALDDFGTGYSSLNYLRRYRVDKIKVDRSFVQRLGISREDDAIVRSIISLARAMGRRVTAEGVETVQQKEHLAALGCHELQGFLLSRPLSGAQLAVLSSGQHGYGHTEGKASANPKLVVDNRTEIDRHR
jgi:EAL domain-containing protein (putative c-di-GMP-specific phosphodiesterase class I)